MDHRHRRPAEADIDRALVLVGRLHPEIGRQDGDQDHGQYRQRRAGDGCPADALPLPVALVQIVVPAAQDAGADAQELVVLPGPPAAGGAQIAAQRLQLHGLRARLPVLLRPYDVLVPEQLRDHLIRLAAEQHRDDMVRLPAVGFLEKTDLLHAVFGFPGGFRQQDHQIIRLKQRLPKGFCQIVAGGQLGFVAEYAADPPPVRAALRGPVRLQKPLQPLRRPHVLG